MSAAQRINMPERDWDRHQQIIERFETAWQNGERPRISQFLPEDEPRRDELLQELVHADLEFRLKAKEKARVEDYLLRYPSLRRRKETVIDLIRTECKIRSRSECEVEREYPRRFPELRDDLEIKSEDLSTLPGLPTPAPPDDRPEAHRVLAIDGPLPRRFGKFELRERLGVGSCSVVYRAWDTVLKRQVSVKLPKVEGGTLNSDSRLLLRDARNSVHLRHDHIVEILDAGRIDGIDFVVRAYIEGKTLADRLRERPLSHQEAAELIYVVADAIDYAHRHEIIHRDLKPSNILLDLQGRPHLMDFGLSRNEVGESTLSPAGSQSLMIGTLAYMSPEQVRGETFLVDGRSDLFSLGIVLYELITGSRPFQGRGRMIQLQIEQANPIRPRELNEEVPADLETICLKALAREPADRYQSGRELANDLRDFLDSHPIGPRPEAVVPSKEKPRWFSRSRLTKFGACLVLVVGLLYPTGRWFQTEDRRESNATALIATCRALLDQARAGHPEARSQDNHQATLAWAILEKLDPNLDGDPALIEVAAEVRLARADRISPGVSLEEAGSLWDRAILAIEAALRAHPDQNARLDELLEALERRSQIWDRVGQPLKAKELREKARSLRSAFEVSQSVRPEMDKGRWSSLHSTLVPGSSTIDPDQPSDQAAS